MEEDAAKRYRLRGCPGEGAPTSASRTGDSNGVTLVQLREAGKGVGLLMPEGFSPRIVIF